MIRIIPLNVYHQQRGQNRPGPSDDGSTAGGVIDTLNEWTTSGGSNVCRAVGPS